MTNNGQTPGGNTTTAGAVEQLEMARRIVNANSNYMSGLDRGQINFTAQEVLQIALAAIIETRKDIVAWLRTEWGMLPEALDFADMIERGDHLKGLQP